MYGKIFETNKQNKLENPKRHKKQSKPIQKVLNLS